MPVADGPGQSSRDRTPVGARARGNSDPGRLRAEPAGTPSARDSSRALYVSASPGTCPQPQREECTVRMRSATFITTVGAVLALAAAAPPHRFEQCTHSPFEGITPTSSAGQVTGEPDRRDWGCVDDPGGRGPQGSSWSENQGLPRNLDVPPPPPASVCLGPAFPNPAPSSTQISFSLPSAARVNLVVYGQRWQHGPREVFAVRTLVDGEFMAGRHTAVWELNDDHGARVSPGLYRAVIVVGDEALCGDIEVP